MDPCTGIQLKKHEEYKMYNFMFVSGSGYVSNLTKPNQALTLILHHFLWILTSPPSKKKQGATSVYK